MHALTLQIAAKPNKPRNSHNPVQKISEQESKSTIMTMNTVRSRGFYSNTISNVSVYLHIAFKDVICSKAACVS